MNFLIADAWAEDAAAAPQGAGIEGLLFPIGLLIILYFFMIRPQVKRQKEHRAMVSALKVGDEVQSMGGLMGTLVEVEDTFVQMRIAEGVVVKVRRASIESVMPKGSLENA
jgi:preprotein translocase subunit YajC